MSFLTRWPFPLACWCSWARWSTRSPNITSPWSSKSTSPCSSFSQLCEWSPAYSSHTVGLNLTIPLVYNDKRLKWNHCSQFYWHELHPTVHRLHQDDRRLDDLHNALPLRWDRPGLDQRLLQEESSVEARYVHLEKQASSWVAHI